MENVFVAFKAGFVEAYRQVNNKTMVDFTRDVRRALTFQSQEVQQFLQKVPQLGHAAVLQAHHSQPVVR
jgi:hypothetical protein